MWKAIAAWIARQQRRWRAWNELHTARIAYTAACQQHRLAAAQVAQALRRRSPRAQVESLRCSAARAQRAQLRAKRAMDAANKRIKTAAQHQ